MARKLTNVFVGGRIHYSHHLTLKGAGMGSILLQKGGPGGGSSYESPEAYEQITGQSTKGVGSGLNDKLSKLMIKPLSRKPLSSNIAFNI